MIQNTKDGISTLLVTCWFPNDETPQAGTFILDHAKSLSSASIDCKVLYIHIHEGTEFFKKKITNYSIDSVDVIEINIQSRFWKYLFQFPLFLKRTILNGVDSKIVQKADIIHSHVIFPSGILGWQLARKYRKPFIITEHWSRTLSFLKKHPLGFLGKKVYENANALIFVSESLKEKVTRKIRNQRISIVPNPIDGNLFYYKDKPKPEPIRCMLAATWKKRSPKRGDLVLEAIRSVKDEISVPFEVDFIGEGDALDEYKTIAKKYNLPVSFCGYEKKEALAERMQKSHFFLHPTESETFGIVVFEALKTGTPVIASNLDVFRKHIHRGNGMLVKNDVNSWREAIKKAFSIQYNYYEIAESYKVPFSQSEVALKTKEVYERAMRQRKSDNFKDL